MKKTANDMNQMNLFNLLGIKEEPEKEEPVKQTEEKPKSETKEKTSTTSKKKKQTKKYKCPITVHGGPYTYQIEEDKEMSLIEIKNHVTKTFPELKGIVTVTMEANDVCIAKVDLKETKLSKIKDQGIFTIKLGKQFVLNEEGVEEAVLAWNTKFPQYVGCKFHYIEESHTLIPFFKQNESIILRTYKLPIQIGFPGMVETFTAEDFSVNEKVSGTMIMEKYSEKHPEFAQCDYMYIENAKMFVPLSEKVDHEHKKCLLQLPIKVATGGYHIEFTSEDFEGASVVTMEQLRVALERMYPEYSEERTIMDYDHRHFVIATLKSSTKGAIITSCRDGFHREVTENGVIEYRPYGKFELTEKEGLSFSLNSEQLKIPKKLLKDIIERFRIDIHRECALQLFMTKDEKGYWLYEPKQDASVCNVCFERNRRLEDEYVLVMDVHSHGTISAFFSEVDDLDEKGIRLYMVVGDFNDNDPHTYDIKLRAGMNGVFEDLSLEDIFE